MISLKLAALTFLCIVCGVGCASARFEGHPPVAYEFWQTGDDGATIRLGARIKDEISKTPGFVHATEYRPGNLIVRIPHNVEGTRSGERIHIVFDVVFSERQASQRERELGVSVYEGQCWLDQLDRCTKLVVRGAVDAANKMRATSVVD